MIDADASFEDLRGRYESLVPVIDPDALRALIEKGDLDQVVRYTAEHTPHTFARFWTFDPTPMMRLVGHRTEVITYMMGNNIVVETMYRHDPLVMLYAPLRTAIYKDSAGATHFIKRKRQCPSLKFRKRVTRRRGAMDVARSGSSGDPMVRGYGI